MVTLRSSFLFMHNVHLLSTFRCDYEVVLFFFLGPQRGFVWRWCYMRLFKFDTRIPRSSYECQASSEQHPGLTPECQRLFFSFSNPANHFSALPYSLCMRGSFQKRKRKRTINPQKTLFQALLLYGK